MKKILLYGSQEYAKTVKEIAEDCGREVVGFIDDINQGAGIIGNFEFLQRNYSPEEYEIALAIGYSNLSARMRILDRIKESNYSLVTLIHPQAYVSKSAKVGLGSIIMARAIVDMRSDLGDGVVCWPGSIISHDCRMENNIFISPGVVICGYCEIGSNTFVGANTTIVNNTVVLENSFIKAGQLYK